MKSQLAIIVPVGTKEYKINTFISSQTEPQSRGVLNDSRNT